MSTGTRSPAEADDLNSALDKIKSDGQEQITATQKRLKEFLDDNNVSMMGGWT
jgi:hypothetical protein